MKKITKKEFLDKEEFYLGEIKKGKIFVYPTDTIYGIGCVATNPKSIEKIRAIKKRDEKPFSIIVPSKNWILKNCEIRKDKRKKLDILPGAYTFILKLKNKDIIAKKELIKNLENIGVRIPRNWFSEFLGKNNLVFVTTSVNISGEPHLLNPENLKEEIAKKIDYLIDEGFLIGKPSKVIDLTKDKEEILRK